GFRLRSLRELHGFSPRALGKQTGVSHATVSLIEQGRMSPSIGVLKKLLLGLGISIADFFAMETSPEPRPFFAADELAELAGGPISFRQVAGGRPDLRMTILHERYAPGADTGRSMLRHDGHEGGVVVKGRLEVIVGGQRRVLTAGDAYYFDSRTLHRFRNLGEEEAEIVTACTPPSF
ncbi:MAG: cupin domain-containing protein, partial [Dehalococcoidia bacterium]